MPHFFINSSDFNDGQIIISQKDLYNHIAKSLRAKCGEKILLIDENEFQYEGIITNIEAKSIEINVEKKYKSNRKLDFDLYLAQVPLRSDSQNLIIEKATELGAKGVYPVLGDNCALKKSVIEQKIPKWQKIMAEASKQCERANIPTCYDLVKLEDLIESGSYDRILAFTERSAKFNLKEYLHDKPFKSREKILVIIGPEGGFSKKEFDYFEDKNLTTLSLGNLILKADTAVIVALGNLVL